MNNLLYNCKNVSSICTLIIVSIYVLKVTTNLKNIFYVDKEMPDIMKNYYQIQRNLVILHDFILILSPNSSLKIMHVLKNVTLKTPRLRNFTQIFTL